MFLLLVLFLTTQEDSYRVPFLSAQQMKKLCLYDVPFAREQTGHLDNGRNPPGRKPNANAGIIPRNVHLLGVDKEAIGLVISFLN